MYYIYHIPDVKIGCTTNPQRRTKEQQATSYEILEEHTCIDTASNREIQLQKEYGYKVDTIPYWKVYKQREQTRSVEASRKGGKIMGYRHKKKQNRYIFFN